MRKIRIEKMVLNIGCGKDKNPDHALKILKTITGLNVVQTKTHRRSTFGVPKNKTIGARITIRSNAENVLKRLFAAVDNKIKESNFDNHGNFAFGIEEYTMIPEMRYDPNIELLGLDVCITLERPGYHVKKKRLSSRVGKRHVITKAEAVKWVAENFSAKIE